MHRKLSLECYTVTRIRRNVHLPASASHFSKLFLFGAKNVSSSCGIRLHVQHCSCAQFKTKPELKQGAGVATRDLIYYNLPSYSCSGFCPFFANSPRERKWRHDNKERNIDCYTFPSSICTFVGENTGWYPWSLADLLFDWLICWMLFTTIAVILWAIWRYKLV